MMVPLKLYKIRQKKGQYNSFVVTLSEFKVNFSFTFRIVIYVILSLNFTIVKSQPWVQAPTTNQPQRPFNPFQQNAAGGGRDFERNNANAPFPNFPFPNRTTIVPTVPIMPSDFINVNRFRPDLSTKYYYSREDTNISLVKYLIIAPEIIQPESIFRVIISTFSNNTEGIDKIEVRLSVFKDGADIRGNSMLMNVGDTEALILQIPMQITNGSYKFRVEGNYPNTQGGSIFLRQSNLTFSAKFLSILIQTNRYIYTGGQKVIFRVILLKRDLHAYGDPVDIYIRDSRDFVMRRYPSVPTKMGVIDLTYELPEYTNLGKWKIQVQAGPQIEEKIIVLEKYFPTLYEVAVTMSPFLLVKDETITATVAAFYGTEKAVQGPARVSLLLRAIDREDWTVIQEDQFWLKSSQDMEWRMLDISTLIESGKTYVVRVEATVTDYFIEEPRHGFAESRIISQSLQLKFISSSPLIFKPGLPFETYLQVSYSDFEKIPPDTLRESHLRITPEVFAEGITPTGTGGIRGQAQLPIIEVFPESIHLGRRPGDEFWLNNEINGGRIFDQRKFETPYFDYYENEFSFPKYYELSKLESYWKTGLYLVRIPKVPKQATKIRLRADYSDAEGNFLAAESIATAFYSPERKFIHIKSNNLFLSVGEYAVVQFKANFFVEKFHYVVLGKGLVLQWGEELLPNPWSVSKTFAVPISNEMAPGFRVIVFSTTRTGEILTDTIFLPVDQFTKHAIDMNLNQNKDRSKDTVELRFFGEPGAYFGISGQRGMRHLMHAGNELSKASVLRNFYELEPSQKRVSHVFWRSRTGEFAEEVKYLQTPNGALDASKVFNSSHILVFVDGQSEIPMHVFQEECETYDNCTQGDCFSYIDHCGKVRLCQNRRFEYEECELSELELIDFRAERVNHIIDFYDPDVGDWAWIHQNLPHGGDYYLALEVPKVTDTWYVTGFAIGVLQGFAIIEEAIEYESNRPFLMTVDAPPAIRRGEQVGVITNLFNKTPKDIFVTIILHGSSDYEFVHAGNDGLNIFDAGQVRFSSGDHHHFVWIPSESEVELRIPVRPTIDQGTIEVGITATAQVRSHTEVIEIEVLAEGVQIGKHTSMILDLKNRAFVLKYLNIFPEVTPEIPYEQIRKYIMGSKAGHVMIYGDIMGPIFPEIPVNIGNLIGKPGKGTADRIFDLAVNVWSLHYLRLTNQLDSSTAKQVFVELNKIFAQIMKRFRPEGYFKMWNLSSPSVWLSAWAIRIFAHGSFQDWENYFYVEQEIFALVTKWILKYQNFDGTFSETMWYGYPLNKRMADGRNLETNLFGPFNVSLTAHVAITLHQVVPILDGGLRVEANIAKNRAIQYLERVFVDLNDPYQIALVTYALTLTDSVEKDAAFSKLHTKRIQDGGFMYWSGGEVPTNAIVYENQRPFTEPKNNEFWDSYAVEGTSYALMVYLMRDGVTPMSEQIVTWLNTMKLTDGSFISSIDTAVTFQALTEYANRARLRDVTDLTVTIEIPSTASVHEVKINSDNIKEVHTFDIEDVWGHVNIIARGSGLAVVQLDLSFGVERDEYKDTPPQDCFELEIIEYYSTHRNKTALTIQSCFRWTYTEESPVSGAAVLEIEIPSGYGIVHSDALALIASGVHPTLKDTVVGPGKTSWYFDHIPAEWTCFNHTVRRWHPVANLTMYKQATLYEAYALERFVNTIYSDFSVRDLTICQVCGSYQCPYCPFFNRSHHLHSSLSREILIILFSMLSSVFIHGLHNYYYYDVRLSK